MIALPDDSAGGGPLTQELGSVLNAGVGFEHVVNETCRVYGAFHTDFSASVGDPASNVAISDWDLYHFSGGVSFRVRDNRFTLGASWATGSKTRPARLDHPAGEPARRRARRGRRHPLLEVHVPARLRLRELSHAAPQETLQGSLREE